MIAGADDITTTAVMLTELVGLAAGCNLLTGEKIAPRRVWLLSALHDQFEIDRQVAAVCSRFEISKGHLDAH